MEIGRGQYGVGGPSISDLLIVFLKAQIAGPELHKCFSAPSVRCATRGLCSMPKRRTSHIPFSMPLIYTFWRMSRRTERSTQTLFDRKKFRTEDYMNPSDTSESGCGETAGEKGMTIFRPPLVRSGAKALNRALFSKKVNLAAAAVNDNRLISKYRKALSGSKELLDAERISPIASHPDRALADRGHKCFLLHPDVKPECQIVILVASFVVIYFSATMLTFILQCRAHGVPC